MPFVPLYSASLTGGRTPGKVPKILDFGCGCVFESLESCPDSAAVLKSEVKTEKMRCQVIPAESFASQGAPNESNATSYAIGEEERAGS